MKSVRWLSAVFLFFSLPASGRSPAETAARLEQKLRSIRTLQADFEQYYSSTAVSTPLHEKGRLFFKKPDLMRWEYTWPEPKTFLYKEEIFSQYYPEDNQLVLSSLSKEEYKSEILALLSGRKDIQDSYAVDAHPFPDEKRRIDQIRLIPRTAGEYSQILLDIDSRSRLIVRAVLIDWAGNRSEFRFSLLKTDIPLSPSLFTLDVPEDCEVIKDIPRKGDREAFPKPF